MILIDGWSVLVAVSFIVIVVSWGYILGTLLAHFMLNWWRIKRAVAQWWASVGSGSICCEGAKGAISPGQPGKVWLCSQSSSGSGPLRGES